ncbi:unnamed protein product [Rotaria sp. Silwood1]|nr:unnamed protein product [Rotaria sp. Silwood1]CAF1205707.1 unnamed protein product [Rotaria sp. Silwood1]CAF1209483.1 unnamed protein product [Rotaria sp. Silwood1]CAF3502913.1 unnamed protein product [Rotaria sp. Silwood1]CAF3502917.1 unnamed protein product [Rotaria sp. Silwood1]
MELNLPPDETLKQGRNQSWLLHQTVECECVPKPKLTCQKPRIDTIGSISTLTINKVDMPDIDVYKVVANNEKERIETQANVDVCVKPKVEGKPADVLCLLSEPVKINVKFSAIPKPTITWHTYKADGTEIKLDARIQIINDNNRQSILIINDIIAQDS